MTNAPELLRGLYRRTGHALERHKRSALRVPRAHESGRATSGRGTVYFLTPDHDRPAGGIRVIYRHVDIHNDAGIPAAVVHQARGFKCTWFDHRTRIEDVGSIEIGLEDLLVLPEVDVDLADRLPEGMPYVIFNQNSHLTWQRATDRIAAAYDGCRAVITVSDHNRRVMSHAFPGADVKRVRISVEPGLFRPIPQEPERIVSWMPRRGRGDDRQVIEILRSRGALDGWALAPLDGLRHDEVAEALQRTRIFMAFTYQEGFGLPAAEAMAAGAYVVGCHGFSGREFFQSRFSAPVETGDVLAFAEAVEAAIRADTKSPGWCRERGLEASDFIRTTYSDYNEKADVTKVWRAIMAEMPEPVA